MEFNLSAGMFSSEEKFSPLDTAKTYDVLILGGGPAGLTAAVYCMRKGVSTGIIVKEIGGQVALTAGIENYMGYRHINGVELVDKFREQVVQFGIDYDEGASIASIEAGEVKRVKLEDGRVFSARALIVATGKSWRKLEVPGEEELTGLGVAYCTTCDGPFYTGKDVIVVGGGNSGLEAAIDLARIASSVTVVQFLDRLTGDRILIDKMKGFENVRVLYETEVTSINGSEEVESVSVRNRKNGAVDEIHAKGIFIEIGLVPNSGFAKGFLKLNEAGEIMVDCACRTSVPGIFAAGDVTDVPFKQIIIAGGEGAKAALSACNYVLQKS
ncbi:MAG: FAD-dependent oxidoreductase [Spirochaetes bacterium]|nr:FAD-dependent oxidoreductase [Spirochaetota bacterium]